MVVHDRQRNDHDISKHFLLRLLVPYVASLLLNFPILVIGIRATRLNGVSASDPGFIQTLVSTAGSERLREIAKKGSGELRGTRSRYGYTLDERG